MKVTIDGALYHLHFEHGRCIAGTGEETDFTTCYFYRDQKQVETCVAATVVRHSADQPNRETARRAAITKLTLHAAPFLKEDRRAIWTAYLNRKAKAPLGARL